MALRVHVECYSGYRAEERPLRFRLGEAGRTREVKEVLDQWQGVGYRCFKVRAADDDLYILRHDEGQDTWEVDAFRHSAKQT